MEAMKISVTGNEAAVTNLVPITGGMVGLPVVFSFDESWEGLEKTAVFRCGNVTLDRLYLENQTTIPWELTKKTGCHLWAGVYGCNGDGSVQIPTVWVDLGEVLPGADPSGDESADPNLPVWKQAFDSKESLQNRVDVIDENADHAHYPTAKAVADFTQPDLCVRAVPTVTLKCGEALLNDEIITLGEGWSGNLKEGFTHAAGNTEPLTFRIDAADGEKYLIFAKFSKAVSAIHLTIGDSYPTDPYGSGNSFVWGVQAVGGGSLKITPFNSNWAGTLYELVCRKITDDGEYEVSVPLDAFAQEEMPNHISGFWDIQMGKNALGNSVNTTRCLGIGYHSLGSLKTGGRNIGLGTYALPYMEYGENNISIGADSGFEVEEAHDCVVIGKAAMSYGKKLKDNIAIGPSALYGYGATAPNRENESHDNIGIGNQAGYKACSYNCIFIGKQAGYHNDAVTSYGNIFLGSGAGGSSTYKSNGNRLVLIGTDTGVKENRNASTVIGAYAKAEGSNCVSIGYNTKALHQESVAIGSGAATTKNNQVVIGSDTIAETLLKGNLVVRGTDGVKRQIVFNADGTCSWVAV